MSKMKPQYEVYRQQRKTWGNVNPATKVIPNKKKHPKKKYKGKDEQW